MLDYSRLISLSERIPYSEKFVFSSEKVRPANSTIEAGREGIEQNCYRLFTNVR